MTYNLHPIFVHFPIALLVLYSVIKILPLARWFPRVAWHDIERALLVTGLLGAFAALATGDAARHLTQPPRQLVSAHSNFATIATWLYAILLIGEALALFKIKKLTWLEALLCHPILSRLIALVALIAISITGLLGGVMAYGLTANPLAPLVLKLLGITL